MLKFKGKNPSIELIRIVACLLVIMAHSQFNVVIGEEISTGLLGMSTIVADDVPLFLLITGFFFFNRVKSDQEVGKAFSHRAKSFLANIYIPTIVYILISIIYKYASNPDLKSIGEANWDYLGWFIFRLTPGDHLWYICTYLSFVFFFPMLAFLCQDNPQRNKMRRILLGVAIGGAVIADVQYFFKMGMLDVDKYLWGYCTVLLVLGYELSLLIRKYGEKRLVLGLSGLGMYLAAFLMKFGLQVYMFNQYGDVVNRFRWLQCAPCFFSAVGLFLVIYSLGSLVRKESIPACAVNFLGSCTFAIYLFHQLVVDKTLSWRFEILGYFGNGSSVMGSFAYYACYSLAVFAITFAISIVFKLVMDNTSGRLFRKNT